jgi:hypothetical protein
MRIEEHGEPAEVEEFRSTVLARQTEAEEAFVTNGDPGPRMDLWSKNDPVTLFGAIGMSQSDRHADNAGPDTRMERP